jgi:hypothetical protein
MEYFVFIFYFVNNNNSKKAILSFGIEEDYEELQDLESSSTFSELVSFAEDEYGEIKLEHGKNKVKIILEDFDLRNSSCFMSHFVNFMKDAGCTLVKRKIVDSDQD